MKVKIECWKDWSGYTVGLQIIESPNRKWYYGIRIYNTTWCLEDSDFGFNYFNDWIHFKSKFSWCDVYRRQL